jgi:hypothetical protein
MLDALLQAAWPLAYLRARAAAIRGMLARGGRRVWRVLEDYGQPRGRHEMLQLARRWEVAQPALAEELRAAPCRGVDRDDCRLMR